MERQTGDGVPLPFKRMLDAWSVLVGGFFAEADATAVRLEARAQQELI